MLYEEVLSAIHSRNRFSSTASLERIARLMKCLGNPQDSMKCIHVAGTNGKGSTCALIESVLRNAGCRVGLFTSPYLVDFRERIQIDRQNISKEELISCYETVMREENALEAAGFEPINEFELVTAIGFLAFSRARVDYAVIEVGLGGRCDPTNVIRSPSVCCITPISLDHTAVLGNTVSAIASEKAGILKRGCPVVCAQQDPEAMKVIRSRAAELCVKMYVPGFCKAESVSRDGSRFLYDGAWCRIKLMGHHQIQNALTAWEACRVIGIPDADIRRGLCLAAWPGRLQLIHGKSDILIDAGHNPAGIKTLTEVLDTMFSGIPVVSVMAMMRDKDYRQCIPPIARRSKLLIAASTGLPRSLPTDELAAHAKPFCHTLTASSVSEGIRLALLEAEEDAMILVCGSVYAAGDAISFLS